MDQLRPYEGPRGFAYLLVILGALGPSAAAFYLLEPTQFAEMAWPKVLLLIGTCGGLSLLLALFFGIGMDFALPAKDRSSVQHFQITIGISSAVSLAVQLGVLAYVSRHGGTFADYFRACLWILGPLAVISQIRGILLFKQ